MNLEVLNLSVTDALDILKHRIIRKNSRNKNNLDDSDEKCVLMVFNDCEFNINFDVKCELEDIGDIALANNEMNIPVIDFGIARDLALSG